MQDLSRIWQECPLHTDGPPFLQNQGDLLICLAGGEKAAGVF